MSEIKFTQQDKKLFYEIEEKLSDASATLTNISEWVYCAFAYRENMTFDGKPMSHYFRALEKAKHNLACFEELVYCVVYDIKKTGSDKGNERQPKESRKHHGQKR